MGQPELEQRQFDEIAKGVVRPATFRPSVSRNETGDCVEFLFASDSYWSERVDDLITVYYSYESGEIVGGLIKGYRSLCEGLLEHLPGLRIEIKQRQIPLHRIIHLAFLVISPESGSNQDEVPTIRYEKYLKVIKGAERADLEMEFAAAAD